MKRAYVVFVFLLIVAAASASAQSADLSVTKIGPTGMTSGNGEGWDITLINNGPDAAANVVLTDILSPQVRFVSITAPAAFTCTTPPVGSSGTVTCSAPSLASGGVAAFTVMVQVRNEAVAPITNSATATSDTPDPVPGNNTGTAPTVTDITQGRVDLEMSKDTPTVTTGPGSDVTFTMNLGHNGFIHATDVVVTDTLPPSLLFQSLAVLPVSVFDCTTPAVGSSGTITCTTGTFTQLDGAQFTLVVRPAPDATGVVTNTVSVTNYVTDSNPANNTAQDSITVVSADLSVTKSTTSTTINTGATIPWVITVTNNGPDTATNVVVTDDIPANLQLVSATPSQGSCSLTDPMTCNLGTLATGASATITLQTTVITASDTITNRATAASDLVDVDPSDNEGAATISVPAAPTLSPIALLLLTVALAVVMYVRAR